MARITGLGGLFYKVADPEKTRAWYQEILGIGQPPDAGRQLGHHADRFHVGRAALQIGPQQALGGGQIIVHQSLAGAQQRWVIARHPLDQVLP